MMTDLIPLKESKRLDLFRQCPLSYSFKENREYTEHVEEKARRDLIHNQASNETIIKNFGKTEGIDVIFCRDILKIHLDRYPLGQWYIDSEMGVIMYYSQKSKALSLIRVNSFYIDKHVRYVYELERYARDLVFDNPHLAYMFLELQQQVDIVILQPLLSPELKFKSNIHSVENLIRRTDAIASKPNPRELILNREPLSEVGAHCKSCAGKGKCPSFLKESKELTKKILEGAVVNGECILKTGEH